MGLPEGLLLQDALGPLDRVRLKKAQIVKPWPAMFTLRVCPMTGAG